MADPVVHITGGVPDSGTGNITTLGMTVAAQAAATSGQLGPMMQGAVTTSAPSYTTATINPLSMTTVGALRVDGSGVTQPVSGTFWQATQPVSGTFWQATQPISAASLPLPTGAATSALQSVTQGVIGAAIAPTTMSLAGGVYNTTKPTLTNGLSASLQLDTLGNLMVAGTVATTQSGIWNLTNISGTVSLPTGAATSALQPTNAALGSTTTGQTGNLELGAVTTAAPTYVTGQSNALSLTTSGALRTDASATTQPVSGTFWQATQPISATSLPLPSGASTSANQPSNAAIGSATSGQTGNLSFGAVTTGLPTYTTAQSNPLSLTTTGLLRVDGSNVTQPVSGTFWQATQPVSIAAAVTVAQATAANLNATVTGTVAATQSGTWTVQQGTPPWAMQGDIAYNVSDSGNPVKIGGTGYTGQPTSVSNGFRTNASFDKQGKLIAVGAIRGLKGVQKTSITTTTETTVVTAAGAGIFNDVYAIVVTNKSATSVFVDFRDATAGTIRMTLAAPANDTRGFTVAVDSAMVQAVAANNWTATVSVAVTSIEISMLYIANT